MRDLNSQNNKLAIKSLSVIVEEESVCLRNFQPKFRCSYKTKLVLQESFAEFYTDFKISFKIAWINLLGPLRQN